MEQVDHEEVRTQVSIFHEHKDEDNDDFSQRYDNIRFELEYPLIYMYIHGTIIIGPSILKKKRDYLADMDKSHSYILQFL